MSSSRTTNVTRAERDRRMHAERLGTAARAGLTNAQRRGTDSWERLQAPGLTAENVRMDGFFETITRAQFTTKLWQGLIDALESNSDAVATWHDQMAKAEREAERPLGNMGNPVADARRHLWLEANRDFARDAADSFRRVS
ncbi:hypothetical protein ACFFSH_28720 [Streptomyces filamentosus]|uniref:Uncharacterized protein n=1 Tax=Streptomyces filamentosus TaxID=67294 RepID=A0A919BXU4_STRFL|nr:hypothetical protein [Streptomyces filamentosus]GHG22988.1 hypothetical protein GCM10017667_68800 [Streptomyces filamentosus]